MQKSPHEKILARAVLAQPDLVVAGATGRQLLKSRVRGISIRARAGVSRSSGTASRIRIRRSRSRRSNATGRRSSRSGLRRATHERAEQDGTNQESRPVLHQGVVLPLNGLSGTKEAG